MDNGMAHLSREASSPSVDHCLDALGHKYRRRLLIALTKHNPQDDEDAQESASALDAITDGEADEEIVEIELHHSHLPKLEDSGYISWDQETGEIAKGQNWDEIAPILELLHNHADELPADWL
jgi:hypothetical protein